MWQQSNSSLGKEIIKHSALFKTFDHPALWLFSTPCRVVPIKNLARLPWLQLPKELQSRVRL